MQKHCKKNQSPLNLKKPSFSPPAFKFNPLKFIDFKMNSFNAELILCTAAQGYFFSSLTARSFVQQRSPQSLAKDECWIPLTLLHEESRNIGSEMAPSLQVKKQNQKPNSNPTGKGRLSRAVEDDVYNCDGPVTGSAVRVHRLQPLCFLCV